MTSPFALDASPYEESQIFRVSSYVIQDPSTWTGNDYDLTLLFNLQPNYLVLIQPSTDTTGTTGPAPAACRVARDPWGTGDLDVSSDARVLRLRREGAATGWLGTVTVIECLQPTHPSGFKLGGVKVTNLGAARAGTFVQEIAVPSGITWNSKIVPFGGLFAGGLASSEVANDRWPTVLSRVRLTSDGMIRYRRWANGGSVQAATATTFLIQFGTDWTVQVASIVPGAPVGGADLDLPAEFSTSAITPVVRARTWFLGTAISPNPQPNGLVLATLGDGVNQNAVESTVAAGVWLPDFLEAECWVMTHSFLSVEWKPTQSTSSVGPLTMGLTEGPSDTEGYRGTSSPSISWGRRAVVLNSAAECPNVGAETEALLFSKFTGWTSLEIWRVDNSVPKIVGWVQVVDFGEVVSASIGSGGPIQGILLPDLEMTGESISSATSRSAFKLGMVVPDSSNVGAMFAFHAGNPDSSLNLTYRVTQHGDLGDAGWVWQDEGASTWYGWNAYNFLHGTHPVNGQTSTRYGFCACYSSAYDRIVTGYLLSGASTSLQILSLDQDGGPFAYSSLGSISLANSTTTPATGGHAQIKIVELDDGSLRLAVVVQDEDGNWDFDIYSSVNGGDSWVRIATRIIWRARGGTALSSQPISVAFASSGDWLRLAWIDGTLEDLLTAVSSSRGTSWDYLGAGSSTITTSDNGYTFDRYALAMAGRPDGAGTFLLWVRDQTLAYKVNGFTSTRDEDWAADTDLGFSLSAGNEVLHLVACYSPDGIFLASEVDKAASGQISYRLRVYDVDDPQGVNSALGNTSIFGPGFTLLPYQLHLLNGRRELILAGNATDFAGAVQPGMFLGRLAGWSQVPVQATSSSGASTLQTWSSLWSDSPSSGTYATWATFSSGATISSSRVRLNIQSGAGQYAYWEFSPSTPGQWNQDGNDRGMACGALVRVPSSAGDVADRNVGIKVRAQGAGASGVSFMLTATSTQISLWDLILGGGTKLASISTPTIASTWWEVRLGLLDNFDVFMAAREYDGATWKGRGEGWTRVSGSLGSAVGVTLDLLQVGNLAYSGAGTNESEWREIWASDPYGNHLQQTGMSWDDFTGRTTTSRPQRLYSGLDVFWGGSGAARRDSFSGEVSSDYPPEAIFLDSPRFYWQAADDGSQAVVLDFGGGSDDGATTRRSLHEGALLVGTRGRYANIAYSQTDSWGTPYASFKLDSTIQSGLRILAVDGQAALVEYPSLPETAASLAGAYFRVTAGATSFSVGRTWRVRKHGIPTQEMGVSQAWLYLESAANTYPLSAYLIQAGDTACAFADRMAILYGRAVKTRYMRVSFDSEEVAPNGKHALGALIAGPFFQFDPPLDWSWKDNDQPNTTRFSSKSGVTWAKQEGPSQRTWQAIMVGDQAQRGRETYRDLLRLFASYDVRPVGLLTQISGSRPLPQASLYGYVSTGGQLDNEGWWKDSGGTWRPSGDTSIQLVEVK